MRAGAQRRDSPKATCQRKLGKVSKKQFGSGFASWTEEAQRHRKGKQAVYCGTLWVASLIYISKATRYRFAAVDPTRAAGAAG